MKLIPLLLLILIVSSCSTRVVKWSHLCRKQNDGEACYKAGLKEYALMEEVRRLDQKEVKKNAANWFKAGCDLDHAESCEKLKTFKKYLK